MSESKLFIVGWLIIAVAGCSSGAVAPVKSQQYAKLSNKRTYEYEFPIVWKAIESAFHNYKVTNRDPNEVDVLEMKKLSRRTLDTEWVYAQSRDKYQEYSVNGSPRKVYLQTRVKYHIEALRTLGAVVVTVEASEEVEKLKDNGDSAGYGRADSLDPSRASEVLDKIGNAVLSAAP